jgi:predicted Rossmann fold nucleotide-binding protein DprA/Smf involved in DNA uptake
MIDLERLSPDAPAIILLCSSIGSDRDAGTRPLGPRTWAKLSDRLARQSFRGPRDLLDLTADEIDRALDVGPEEASRYVRLLARGGQLAFELDRLRSRGIWVVTIVDEAYPQHLADRLGPDAPPVLFGSGDSSLLGRRGVAIVGSRDADSVAVSFTEHLAAALARGGVLVISGGAKGIDATAMRSAADAGGPVVGVLAEGVERRLRDGSTRAVVASGQAVLVSPYHPGAAFSAGGAMGRNKIVYALSDVAVVVSSATGSGGTWTGAIEAIKGGWVPVLVRDTQDAPDGNRALIARGGVPLPAMVVDGDAVTVESLVSLVPAGERRVAEGPAPYQQQSLFDEP